MDIIKQNDATNAGPAIKHGNGEQIAGGQYVTGPSRKLDTQQAHDEVLSIFWRFYHEKNDFM